MREIKSSTLVEAKRQVPFHSEFAKEAFELLTTHGKDFLVRVGSKGAQTNLVAIRQNMKTPKGVKAIRLQSVLALSEVARLSAVEAGVPKKLFEPSDELSVLRFQFADLSAEYASNVFLRDVDIAWLGSLLAVVNTHDVEDATVLDLNTGRELGKKKVSQAMGYLSLIGACA